MKPAFQGKYFAVTPPAAIYDNASLTTAEIDTQGYRYLQVVLFLGATDIALTACKLTQSDTSGSGHADMDNADLDGDTDAYGGTAALPSATDDNKFVIWNVDLNGKKRYIDATVTVGDGTLGAYAAMWAILSDAEIGPDSATDMGADTVMAV